MVLDDDEFHLVQHHSTLGLDSWRAVTAVLTSLVFHSHTAVPNGQQGDPLAAGLVLSVRLICSTNALL